MAGKDPIERSQAEARAMARAVDAEIARLVELRERVPLDHDEVSEAMAWWDECPSLEFYVHGCLGLALTDLRDASEHLARAGAATPETIREEWLRLRGEE